MEYVSYLLRFNPQKDEQVIQKLKSESNKNDYVRGLIMKDLNIEIEVTNDDPKSRLLKYYQEFSLLGTLKQIMITEDSIQDKYKALFEYLAAGINWKSAGTIKLETVNLFFAQNEANMIDRDNRRYHHLLDSLDSLKDIIDGKKGDRTNSGYLNGLIESKNIQKFNEIQPIFMEYWEVIKSSTFTYRALLDLAYMASIPDTKANLIRLYESTIK